VLGDFGTMGFELTRPVQVRRKSGVGSSSRIQYTPLCDLYAHQQGGIDPVWTYPDRPSERWMATVPNWDSGKMERCVDP